MYKTMVSVASLEKIEIIRSQEFMLSEARLKILKKKIILGPKTAILGPQFCRILVLGPHFYGQGGPGPQGPPGSTPVSHSFICLPLPYMEGIVLICNIDIYCVIAISNGTDDRFNR